MAKKPLPPIRLAVIQTRVKYNATGCASNVRWAWRTETREELQYQDTNGCWYAIPRVTLPLDDSAEQAETAAGLSARLEGSQANARRVAAMRQLAAMGEDWVPVAADGEFGRFLDAQRAETSHIREPDGFSYYRSLGGRGTAVARFNATQHHVLISVFADWLDPAMRLARLQEVIKPTS